MTPEDEPETSGSVTFGGDRGLFDRDWDEADWDHLLQWLVSSGMVRASDVAALVLGHLNPSQVGTSLASSTGFKRNYGKGNVMPLVIKWFYEQSGRCEDCGSRLELQADHDTPRESYADPLDADKIENMVLRCRRCNVLKRPSHERGRTERTYLTAESALMWILLVIRPRNLQDYVTLCRLYGMTMADVRMQEAWAMSHWLQYEDPSLYEIDDDTGYYDVLSWSDSALTRQPAGMSLEGDPAPLAQRRRSTDVVGFITEEDGALYFYQRRVAGLPFSVYDLAPRPRNDVAIDYISTEGRIAASPPRNRRLLTQIMRTQSERFKVIIPGRRAIPIGPDFSRRQTRRRLNVPVTYSSAISISVETTMSDGTLY